MSLFTRWRLDIHILPLKFMAFQQTRVSQYGGLIKAPRLRTIRTGQYGREGRQGRRGSFYENEPFRADGSWSICSGTEGPHIAYNYNLLQDILRSLAHGNFGNIQPWKYHGVHSNPHHFSYFLRNPLEKSFFHDSTMFYISWKCKCTTHLSSAPEPNHISAVINWLIPLQGSHFMCLANIA